MNQTIAPTYFPCSFHASKVEASTVLAAWFAVMGRGYDLRAAPHVMTIDEQKRLASEIACFAAGFRAGQRRAKRAKQIEIPTIRG